MILDALQVLTFRDGVYCCLIDVGVFVALNVLVRTKGH